MKTRGQVKREFSQKGLTISDWAKDNGYNRSTVYAVLNGQLKLNYGVCHKIALDLGIKKI